MLFDQIESREWNKLELRSREAPEDFFRSPFIDNSEIKINSD